MNPDFDPNSYSTPGGSMRLQTKLAQLEAKPSNTEYIRIFRALHDQLLAMAGKLREEKRVGREAAFKERQLNTRIDMLTKYCKTLAVDRTGWKKREKKWGEKLATLEEDAKEKRQLFRMLYGYAADRLSEVDGLKGEVTALRAEKAGLNSRRAPVSACFRLPTRPQSEVKTVLGKRKADEAALTVSPAGPPSSDATPPKPEETSPPCAVRDAPIKKAAISTPSPQGSPKRTKHPESTQKHPRNVVSCTQCHAHGLQCDHGAPCQPCTTNKKKCKRMRCATYGKGKKTCLNRHCFFAHPEDGYANTIQCSGARRGGGLPPVGMISRW